jgi:hypothetical protein
VSSPAEQSNTSTINVPPQFTASGVGSAIPISNLGNTDLTVTDLNFVGVSTRPAITIAATTIAATVVSGTAVPATTMPGTTIPATTITGTAVSTDGAAKKGEAICPANTSVLLMWLLMVCSTYGVFTIFA